MRKNCDDASDGMTKQATMSLFEKCLTFLMKTGIKGMEMRSSVKVRHP